MKKLIISEIIAFLLILSFENSVSAKYCIEENFTVASINIDRTLPQIQVENISKPNDDYILKFKITVTDKNLEKDLLNLENVKVMVYDMEINPRFIHLEKVEDIDNGEVYIVGINDMYEALTLKIIVLEGATRDESGNINQRFEQDILIY